MTQQVSSIKAEKRGKVVSIDVRISEANGQYPARVLVARNGLSEYESTLGYFDATEARKFAKALINAAEMVDKLPKDVAKEPSAVTTRSASTSGDVARLSSEIDSIKDGMANITTVLSALVQKIASTEEPTPVTRGRARASRK